MFSELTMANTSRTETHNGPLIKRGLGHEALTHILTYYTCKQTKVKGLNLRIKTVFVKSHSSSSGCWWFMYREKSEVGFSNVPENRFYLVFDICQVTSWDIDKVCFATIVALSDISASMHGLSREFVECPS